MKRFILVVALTLASSVAFGQRYYLARSNCRQCFVQQTAYTSQSVYYGQQIYTQPITYSTPVVSYAIQPATPVVQSSSVPVITASSTNSIPITTASYSTPVYQPTTGYSMSTYTAGYSNIATYSSGSGLAQQKAQIAASRGLRGGHVGGGFGGGRFEGVGFSTSSPQAAIQSACYWGQRPVHQIGVARGRDGWYATVLYR